MALRKKIALTKCSHTAERTFASNVLHPLQELTAFRPKPFSATFTSFGSEPKAVIFFFHFSIISYKIEKIS
jgi:hypothetical protein